MDLPDLNAETYPFEIVERLLDRSAFFDLYSESEPEGAMALQASGEVIGFDLREVAHRFRDHTVGQPLARISHRWLLMPEGFAARPDREPPPFRFEPGRSQRFAMLGTECRFGDGADGFRGFGTGRTYPGAARLRAAAVGVFTEGFGKLAGGAGIFTYNGELAIDSGYRGQLMIRVLNPADELLADSGLRDFAAGLVPEPGVTYLHVHGRKKSKHSRTEFMFRPDGGLRGFRLEQELTQLGLRCGLENGGGLRSRAEVGRVIGRMTSQVFLNILDPGAPGTVESPIPFDSRNEFTFTDGDGRAVGSFVASGGEGRTFTLQLDGLPRQQALRFGAFQLIGSGTGCFQGIEGILTDNSAVGVAPHATSTLYSLRLADPDGRCGAVLDTLRP